MQGRATVGRAVSMGALVCTCAAIAVILGLVPAYMTVHTERVARDAALAALQDAKEGEHSDRETLLVARKRTAALQAIGKKGELSTALSLMLASRPKGVALRTFVYAHKDNAATLSVSGTAPDSATFRQYTDVLKGKTPIDKVTVPLTSLANLEGGAFTISVSGAF